MSLDDQVEHLEHLVVDLTREFGAAVAPEDVREEVMRVYSGFSTAKIRQYVPVLTRRIVREQLIRPQAQSGPDLGWIATAGSRAFLEKGVPHGQLIGRM